VPGISVTFAKVGTVVEINPACQMGDTSSVRVVVARGTPTGIRVGQRLGNPGKGTNGRALGFVFNMEVLHIWPRAEQADTSGRLRPFFPRPPSPGYGGGGMAWAISLTPLFGPVL
jgi:hypothetical protein